ncbi:helix-turn-helix transcriptional regulator [Streptomyces roseicoloratus]|uniref:Helix-turn-helix transcriptional regulator n=1 Tax=Streptomyces roseicoloratus TaxID=2508722 RepID=A0ABY9S7N7_9ACTN|nr:helix-turn-helix transcriptional regulator [Streptomyces roseicoloratus]WMX49005.1 helix-turn-helix transcriptional regulator [Streptomyces roseicoloratus]
MTLDSAGVAPAAGTAAAPSGTATPTGTAAAASAAAPTAAAEPAAESDVRRHELAAFLRSRRERISPEQVGLPRGRRRRTPGLRREEVAQLSAVGVTWYTWLEQARPIQVSPQVLDALAGALQLDPTERAHLFSLAGQSDPHPETACPTVTPTLRALLDQLEPIPAAVQNSRYDFVAYNRTFGRLFCDLDALPREDRNSLWLAFTNEEFRAVVTDLPAMLRALAGKLRAAMADHLAEPAWKTLLRRLQEASPEFRELWARHDVVDQSGRTKLIDNAHVGLLRLDHTNLWLGPAAGPRLVTYVPVDEATRAGIERLHALVLAEEAARAGAVDVTEAAGAGPAGPTGPAVGSRAGAPDAAEADRTAAPADLTADRTAAPADLTAV